MKLSTLVSVALATTAQITCAIPLASLAEPDQEVDNFGPIEVRGVGHLHEKFLKKRAIDASKQMTDTNNGWAGGIQAGNNGIQMVIRREIRELYDYRLPGDSQAGRVYDLYILALRRTMYRNPNDKNSWWQLAGVHGRPYLPWNNRRPGTKGSDLQEGYTNSGYCTHGSTLFLPWHRPYLAYVEELLWASAYLEIQKETRPAEKAQWEAALEQFRLPYWDWGLENADLPPQVSTNQHTFRFYPNATPATAPKWENPLYTFKFQSGTYNDPAHANFGESKFNNLFRTVRHPPNQEPGVGDNIGEARNQLRQNGNNVRQQVHELLLRSLPQDSNANILEPNKINTASDPARWGAFSNRVGNNAASAESIHDGIHVWVGGTYGHMTSVPYSSFDPIFFLHHTNVDRIFAIWQAINPKSYVTPQQNGGGTYGVDWRTTDTVTSPLEPWLRNGWRLNSDTVRDTGSFGYGYAAVPKHLYPNSPTGLRRYAMKEVSDLYSGRVSSATKRKRDLYSSEENKGLDNSIVNNKYYEWRVDVSADRGALNGTYSVHFFLGRPSRDYRQWTNQPEFVGDYVVFTHSMEAPPGTDPATINTEITGSVPLTDAMVNAFSNANLSSLNPQHAIPFLIRNLRWRVTDSTGAPVRARNVLGLKVSVSISHTTLPTDEVPWTQYGEWTFLTEIARRIGKDGGPDSVGIPDTPSTSTTLVPTTTEAPAYATDLPTTLITSATEEPTSEAVTTEAPTSVAEYVEIPASASDD
ncbi:uncharacterized protein DFL_008051 [Arthrobotrys flagrans]|uniref:tyrosinase n=1 Tax=Arthrobotrys flagrans TaxID=97331 RepID=A0A436ZMN6_ARTFL|nr:hypothetical protein DFL_008051 [Arthrobotrys flagrans]